MFSLVQSQRVRGSAGEPIPTVWQAFEDVGIVFRRGQLVLIAAGPGTGKSAMTLTQVIQASLPALMFSADSDAFTQLTRSICILSGVSVATAAHQVLNADIPQETLDSLTGIPLRIDYEASPTPNDMEDLLEAYCELYGEYPAIVVVDNITNVRSAMSEDGDPFSGLEGLMDYLHGMARGTGACVIGLHHVTGDYNNGDKPIPLNGVKGQITRVPEMVLTMFRGPLDDESTIIRVSPVKNRGGKQDPTGNTYAELQFRGDSMSITDLVVPDFEEHAVQIDERERRQHEGVFV